MAFEIVGTSLKSGQKSTSLNLPAGTREGDLILFILTGINLIECHDRRLTPVHHNPYGDVFYVGFADGVQDPINYRIEGTSNRPDPFYMNASMAVIRGWIDLYLDQAVTRDWGPVPAVVPAPPKPPSDKAAAITFIYTLPGGYVSTGMGADAFGNFHRIPNTSTDDGYGSGGFYIWIADEPGESPPVAEIRILGSSPSWLSYTFAFTVPGLGPVTRVFPRDDGRNASSAPRVYPPPSARRVFGGIP